MSKENFLIMQFCRSGRGYGYWQVFMSITTHVCVISSLSDCLFLTPHLDHLLLYIAKGSEKFFLFLKYYYLSPVTFRDCSEILTFRGCQGTFPLEKCLYRPNFPIWPQEKNSCQPMQLTS